MFLILVLTFIKSLIFINFTEIEHNVIMVFLVSTSFSLFVMTWIYTSQRKNKKFYLGLYYTLVSLVLFADVLYYSHFQTLPSISMLLQIKLLPNVSSSVINIVGWRQLLLVVDLPFIYYYLRKSEIDLRDYLPKKMSRIIPLGFLSIFIITFAYSEARGLNNSLKYQELYTYHINDILERFWIDKHVIANGYELSENDIAELKDRAKYKEGNLTGIGKNKNLIVLQVEALQNFVIDLNYNGQEITPNLNRFVHDNSSIYYDKYYHVTARGNTSDAEFVSNNSLYPATDAPSYSKYEENTFYGLPWLMRDNGYKSLAFHGYEKDFWNRDKAYKNQGFQRFFSQEDFTFDEKIIMGIKDEDFFSQSVDILKRYSNYDKPFYAFMVSLSSHDPFVIPEEYQKIDLLPKHEETIIGDYLQAIHYFDYSFGILIEELKEADLYDNSVIALYGDHFAIQDNKDTDYLMSELLHSSYGPEEVMNVPLVIQIPGQDLGYTNSKLGSQLDFFPTILNIMGYKNEKGIVFGRDLNNYNGQNFVAPQSVMNEGSFISDDVVFQVPKTREFKDSMAYDIEDNQKRDIWKYKETFDFIKGEVEKSDYILKTDRIKDIIENFE